MAKKKVGRPKKLPVTDELLVEVRGLASQGLTRKQISAALGISEALRCRMMNNEPEFKTAIEEGEAAGIAQVTNSLMVAARSGNVTAQIFYLKNRDPDNWRDRREYEATHRHLQPEVEISKEMSAQDAADAYADTLKRGRSENVVPIRK
jgi:hypothetical protein